MKLSLISGSSETLDSKNPEYIISAQHVRRDKRGGKNIFSHHGIVVTTDHENKYLLHSLPIFGNTMRNAILSQKWESIGLIPIGNISRGRKITLDDLLYEGSGFGPIGYFNYFTGGTCHGSFFRMKFFLLFGVSFNKIIFFFLLAILLILLILLFCLIKKDRKVEEIEEKNKVEEKIEKRKIK